MADIDSVIKLPEEMVYRFKNKGEKKNTTITTR